MPPRRSARLAGGAPPAHGAVLFPPLSPLPLALVLHIFSLLPLDARLRCAMVSRGWRVTFSERSLWARLDLSPASGLARAAVTDALLSAAAARAGGQLQALDVSGCERITSATLLAAVRANADALQALRACTVGEATSSDLLGVREIEAVLRAAPQLRVFDTEVTHHMSFTEEARRMLRNEGVFAPLRMHRLWTGIHNEDADSLLALTAAVAAHASLTDVLISGSLALPATLDAVVDAALARRLSTLALDWSRLTPAAAPALARLLQSGALRCLFVSGHDQLLDAAAAAMLSGALRANTTLVQLHLTRVRLWHDPAAAALLLGALTAHPSLRVISLHSNEGGMHVDAAVADALGALVAANTPALKQLDLDECEFTDTVLRPLFEALPANTHLHELDCMHNDVSAAFMRNVLLPALRANTTLIGFSATFPDEDEGLDAEVTDVIRLIQARADAIGTNDG
jgi:hypothetical protein